MREISAHRLRAVITSAPRTYISLNRIYTREVARITRMRERQDLLYMNSQHFGSKYIALAPRMSMCWCVCVCVCVHVCLCTHIGCRIDWLQRVFILFGHPIYNSLSKYEVSLALVYWISSSRGGLLFTRVFYCTPLVCRGCVSRKFWT